MSIDRSGPRPPSFAPPDARPSAAPPPQEVPADAVTPPDDATLLAAHVAGDPQAFGVLVARHQDRLWAVALRTLRNPDEAADALQEALISAFRRAESFRAEARVTTWLHRIVVNACLDQVRRRRTRPTEPLPDDAERLAELGQPFRVEDPVLSGELHRDIVRALAVLNVDQRTAIVLVDMEGYSVEEAASLLGCAPGTIKSRCSRGRAKLVPLLAGHKLDTTENAQHERDRSDEHGPHARRTVRTDRWTSTR